MGLPGRYYMLQDLILSLLYMTTVSVTAFGGIYGVALW
jgi:hypothetical protein